MDDLRFRNGGGRLPQPVSSPLDPRTSLPRRFTTESGLVPTLSTITNQRGPEQQNIVPTTTLHKVQLLERKRLEYEKLREQKRRFEAEMQKLDQQQRREEKELAQMQKDLGGMNVNGGAGHQSEPTTPPEYRETSSGFPTMFSRPNRYSASSLISPPGLYNRPSRSSSQLASPPSGIIGSHLPLEDVPSRSVPGSRRNSDEDEKEEAVRQDPTSHRATNALNRYSMPVTRSRSSLYDILDQTNTTRFLFGDEDSNGDLRPSSKINTVDDSFPTLVRREANMFTASSSALDLATLQSPGPELQNSSKMQWENVNSHRSQQSLSTLGSVGPLNGASSIASGQSSDTRTSSIRHSLDMQYYQDNASDISTSIVSPATSHIPTPPKLQTSLSTNDIPTVKNVGQPPAVPSTSNQHATQYLHHHNASLGRVPAGAMPNRHSREFVGENAANLVRDNIASFASMGSNLQANAAPFGPAAGQVQNPNLGLASAPSSAPYPGYFGNGSYHVNGAGAGAAGGIGYNPAIPMLATQMAGLGVNGAGNHPVYSNQNFTGYGAMYNQASTVRDSQARVIQNRRQQDNEAMSRYQHMSLQDCCGQIYAFCKDQHGCRFLQKQLERRDPEEIHMIWLETSEHVVELMTDPFGNYLCQKLLEYCNDEERTVLIQNAASDMVRIALNQHGTRALQKMIEFISTPEQIQIIVEALRSKVVELIQDLNGNHVIQKCLNKLTPQDANFIFEAVGKNCIEVGTHRHGCCVLQRCIDHASGVQKTWLIGCITDNAVALVQDPFGNYVVQYIIDLNEPSFTEPLVRKFHGRICTLSRHKFSSNVIEKCLRCANGTSKDLICTELLIPGEMDRLLRDSFANYVIQTALDYATQYMKHTMVETIRPLLPAIRSTPYGRRIQAKIQVYDSRNGHNPPGQVTPSESGQGQAPARGQHSRGMSNSNSSSIINNPGFQNGFNGLTNGGPIPVTRGQVPAYPASAGLTVPPPQPARAGPFQPAMSLPPTAPGSMSRAASGIPAENGESSWF